MVQSGRFNVVDQGRSGHNGWKHTGPSMDTYTLGHILKEKSMNDVTVIDSTATLSEAWETLARLKILSAPAVMKRECAANLDKDSDDELEIERFTAAATPIGFIDVESLLAAFLDACPTVSDFDLSNTEQTKKLGQTIQLAANRVKQMKVINAIATDGGVVRLGSSGAGEEGYSLSLRRIINTLFTSTLTDLVHHRVAVLDDTGAVKYIVSQSDLVRFIHKTEETYGSLGDFSLADLRLGSNTVLTIPEKTPTLLAFATLHKQNKSCAGIVNADGQLVANLSKSDLRGISPEGFSQLVYPVSEFLQAKQGDSVVNGGAPTPKYKLFSTNAEDSLANVLTTIIDNGLHRIYVVDGDGRPTAIVTLTDILRLFANH